MLTKTRRWGWIRLVVSFQQLMVISPTAMQVGFGGVCRCQCKWVNVDLSCLGWTIYARTVFGCQATDSVSATGEQNGITSTLKTIYTDSEPSSRLPNSLMPSTKLRSAFHLPVLRLWYDAVGDWTLASCTPSGRSDHYSYTEAVVKYSIRYIYYGNNIFIKGLTLILDLTEILQTFLFQFSSFVMI